MNMEAKYFEGSVRRARPGDHKDIYRVLQETYRPFLLSFKPTALNVSAEEINLDPSLWVAAEVASGDIVGAAKAWEEFGYMTFCFLSVASSWKKKGVGRALVEWIITESRQQGIEEARIVLRRELDENIRYFETFGFRYLCDFGTGKHDFYHLPLSPDA